MKLRFWGTRGSVPVSGDEFAGHGGCTTCIEVDVSESGSGAPDRLIIDCGSGLVQLGRQCPDVSSALFLQTHMHWDHIQGFPFFAPLHNPAAAFDFWAVPRSGQRLRKVFCDQMAEPTFPIGLDALSAQLNFEDIDERGERHLGDLTVKWAEMCHPFGCTAYRIEHDDQVFVFSGDVEIQQGCRCSLVDIARGADVFVMDAQYFPAEYEGREGFGHSTPQHAVEVAVAAGVERLVMTHHDPSHDDTKLQQKLACARREAAGRVVVDNAADGLVVDVGASVSTPHSDAAVV